MAIETGRAHWRAGKGDAAESWWATLASSQGSFWLHHGLRSARHGPGHAEIVAAWFDPRPRAVRVVQPLGSLAIAQPFALQLGRTRFGPGYARGEAAGAREWFAWNLAWPPVARSWTRRTGPWLRRGSSGTTWTIAWGATGTVTTAGNVRPVGATTLALGHRWGVAPVEWLVIESLAEGTDAWTIVGERASGSAWHGEALRGSRTTRLDPLEVEPMVRLRARSAGAQPWQVEVELGEAAWLQLPWTDASGARRWIHRTHDARLAGTDRRVAVEFGSSQAWPSSLVLG